MKKIEEINICQVSLKRDIPLILKNYLNFKKFYKQIKIFVICPSREFFFFKDVLKYDEFQIISEDQIISLNEFEKIFLKCSEKIIYKNEFRLRLNWYYQQILKLSFMLNFFDEKKKNLIIWDADTIIINKIHFYNKEKPINYGTFNEFHKQYYITNLKILGILPRYYISFLNQFVSITSKEAKFLESKLFQEENKYKIKLSLKISELILKKIFSAHRVYNGSMFSEFELIGQSNYLLNNNKQKPILSLRFGLDGVLSNKQLGLVKFLGFKHITYEHSHPNKKSLGMLNRQQSWTGLIKIISKNVTKFVLRSIKHDYFYKKNYGLKNK